jgi:putative NADH-flavin reductase
MKLVILGATGATGTLVVEQALAAGHRVTALVRSPHRLTITHRNLRVVKGDATDAAAVATSTIPDTVKRSLSQKISRADVAAWLVDAATAAGHVRHNVALTATPHTRPATRRRCVPSDA